MNIVVNGIDIDVLNYLSVELLESMGIVNPPQEKIDGVTQIFEKISFLSNSQLFNENLLSVND